MMHGFGPGGCFGGYGLFGSMGGLGLVGGIINLVLTLGLIAGMVLLVIWLVRRLTPGGQPSAPAHSAGSGPSAREILQQRYARGEIDRAQYKDMLADLS